MYGKPDYLASAIRLPANGDQLVHVNGNHMNLFGQHIRMLRRDRKLLLRQVAAEVHVDPSYLSRIELGTKCATRKQVVQLAGILGTDATELLVRYLSDRVQIQLEGEDRDTQAAVVENVSTMYGKGGCGESLKLKI